MDELRFRIGAEKARALLMKLQFICVQIERERIVVLSMVAKEKGKMGKGRLTVSDH